MRYTGSDSLWRRIGGVISRYVSRETKNSIDMYEAVDHNIDDWNVTESEEDEARELLLRHEQEEIEVHFFPMPVVTRTPDPNTYLWNQRSVNTVKDDMLEVIVNGHLTLAFLDTGCTSCVIRFEKAVEMGLL